MLLLKNYEIDSDAVRILAAWIFVIAAPFLPFIDAIYYQSVDGMALFSLKKVVIALIATVALVGTEILLYHVTDKK